MNKRHLLRSATMGVLALAVLAPAAPSAAAVVDLQPEDLTRGPDIAVPHLDGTVLVDGDRRVRVPGDRARLVGASGNGFVVGTTNVNGGNQRLFRVKADDTVTRIARGVSVYEAEVSEDGKHVVTMLRPGRRSTEVVVLSARSGKRQAGKAFRSWPTVLGMEGNKVYVTRWSKGVTAWNVDTGRTRSVVAKPANHLDLGADVLAYYTKDPYDGGCVKVVRFSDPGTVLWKSCDERVAAVSPDGQRIATVDLLADGIGPRHVWEREIDGTLLAEYETGWFGGIWFETDTDLLLEVNGEEKAATVRCSEGDCEKATRAVRVRMPRLAG